MLRASSFPGITSHEKIENRIKHSSVSVKYFCYAIVSYLFCVGTVFRLRPLDPINRGSLALLMFWFGVEKGTVRSSDKSNRCSFKSSSMTPLTCFIIVD